MRKERAQKWGSMLNIGEIKSCFQAASLEELPELIKRYSEDERGGVRKLVEASEKKLAALQREKERIEKLRVYEEKYREYEFICGIDEVGRGPLAGPVVAGAVILPRDCRILYINDSKQLSEKKREELFEIIREKAVAFALGYATPERIDEINILDLLLNDAVTIPKVDIPQVPIIKGDAKSITIGAASIVAKVTRDRLMEEYDKVFPEYDFARNKGYGSPAHIEALKKYGPSVIHRKSFIKNFIEA